MLYYFRTDEKSVKKIKKEGLKKEVQLHSVESLDFESSGVTLVVDPLELSLKQENWYGKKNLSVSRVPASAIRNIDPYNTPKLVIAGGGFVVRQKNSAKEIVLIYRKGKWDIPKGKLDDGESVKECARREIQEEIGVQNVKVLQSLGSTWHCYERKGKFCIKRTYWYEMKTKDKSFYPQEEEDIEEVAWHSWDRAKELLGFPIFRMHMEHVEPLIMK